MRPGPRDELITQRLVDALADVDATLIERGNLDAAEAPDRLSRHLARVMELALRGLEGDGDAQARLINQVLASAAAVADRHAEQVVTPPKVWLGLREPPERLGMEPRTIPAPTIPLASSDLLSTPRVSQTSAASSGSSSSRPTSVDLLCAFVIWSGVVQLRDALAA